LKVFETIDGI
jgi:hypothetical protein